MIPHVVEARHVSGTILWLRFDDGADGEVDLATQLHGEIFEPLLDVDFLRQFRVDPTLGTLVWPNGADFAPEFLRASLKIAA